MSAATGSIKNIVAFFARFFIGFYFLINGLHNATSFSEILNSMSSSMAHSEGVLMVVTILQFLAAVLIIIGWYTRFGGFVGFVAILIVTWMEILVTPTIQVHDVGVWLFTFLQFVDNLCIIGATWYVMAFGPGWIAIDQLRYARKARKSSEG